LISCVLPGVFEVFARLFWPVSILISDDLPTLDRPMNAYSGMSGLGQRSIFGLLTTNVADFISI
jgi:hypothetical protein